MKESSQAVIRDIFSWGGRAIAYELTVERRNDLAITVHPDLRVTVRAPDSKPMELIRRRLRAKSAWIAKQIREFEGYLPLPTRRRFIAGETHRYLGRQYRLRLATGAHSVTCGAGQLVVNVPDPERPDVVEQVLNRWYAVRANAVFGERLSEVQRCVGRLSKLDVNLRVRRMKRRWGSCAPSGTVTLNIELVRAPKTCIDYVIVHELCHLLVPAHSPRFFELLRTCLPDWERRRARLNWTLD